MMFQESSCDDIEEEILRADPQADDGEEEEEDVDSDLQQLLNGIGRSIEDRKNQETRGKRDRDDEQGDSKGSVELDGGAGSGKKGFRSCLSIPTLTLVVLGCSNIGSAMFYSLLAPFFPNAARRKGATEIEIGLIMGSFPVVVFLVSPWMGRYLTSLGSKFLFVSGSFICSGCALLFSTLEWCPDGTVYVVLCFLLRMTDAVGSAAASTAAAAIATYTHPNRISTAMGILQACSCIGLTVGPAFGGILYDLQGFFLPFVVNGGLFMVCCVSSLILLPSQDEQLLNADIRTPAVGPASRWMILKSCLVHVIGYLIFIGQFTLGFVDVTLSVHIQDDIQKSISGTMVGVIFLIPSAIVIVLAPIYGFVTDRKTELRRPIIVLGTVISGLGFLGFGPSPLLPFLPRSVPSLIGSIAVSAVGWGSMSLTYQELARAATERGYETSMATQGIVSGINSAYGSLGAFLGPTLGGILMQSIGFYWASTIVAFLILSAAFVFFTYCVFLAFCSRPVLHQPDVVRSQLIATDC